MFRGSLFQDQSKVIRAFQKQFSDLPFNVSSPENKLLNLQPCRQHCQHGSGYDCCDQVASGTWCLNSSFAKCQGGARGYWCGSGHENRWQKSSSNVSTKLLYENPPIIRLFFWSLSFHFILHLYFVWNLKLKASIWSVVVQCFVIWSHLIKWDKYWSSPKSCFTMSGSRT